MFVTVAAGTYFLQGQVILASTKQNKTEGALPFTISDGVRNRMSGQIRQVFETMEVRKNIGPRADATLFRLDDDEDGVLKSLTKQHREVVADSLGNLPMWALVSAKVTEATDALLADLVPGESRPLREVLSNEQREQLAQSIVDELLDLPRPYVYSFCLPRKFTEMYREAAFAPIRRERVVLEGSWQRVKDSLPIVHVPQRTPTEAVHQGGLTTLADLMRVAAPIPYAAPEDRVYLHLSADGFVSRRESFETSATARQALRSFVGLGRSLNFLNWEWPSENGDILTAIHHRVGEGFAHVGETHLYGREEKFIKGLTLPDPMTASHEVWAGLNNLALLFSLPSVGAHIKLAGKWLFDYFTEDDSAMRVMHVAIATEVLLGSSGGEEGVTKTLATRLAYLIAQSSSERKALEAEFKGLYQMRSKIVHNGHQRLNRKEFVALRRFGELAGRVVAAEVRLALADIR